HEATGTPPVLLLDDVFSELDPDRSRSLLAHLPPGQAVLTTAGPLPAEAHPDQVVVVADGAAQVRGRAVPWKPLPRDEDPPPAPLGQPLDRLLRNLGAPPAKAVRSVFDDWVEVVGEPVASNARPVSLRRGRLVVAVPDAAWATQLRYLE